MTTFLSIVGTRPEVIRIAMVQRALRARGHAVLVHMGRLGEKERVLYRHFGLEPDHHVTLEPGSHRLSADTAVLLGKIAAVIEEVQPDVVLVQGDSMAAMVAALAANDHGAQVAHVDAGRRAGGREPTVDRNHDLIGRLASWHFVPTPEAARLLRCEGVPGDVVFDVGDTAVDAARWAGDRLREGSAEAGLTSSQIVRGFVGGRPGRKLVLVMASRPETRGQAICDIAYAVGSLVADHPDAVVVWPVHPDPEVRQDVADVMGTLPARCRVRICLAPPLDYPVLLSVLACCDFTLTDSDRIQEEATALGRPVLMTTGAGVDVDPSVAGGAIRVGTDFAEIVKQSSRLLTDPAAGSASRNAGSCGDGHSARRIADVLAPVELRTVPDRLQGVAAR
jgi:UDP-N-acetylglucosamine 2-epimerase (non-hydrolysing)